MDRRWLALPVILTAIFMAILDVFVVNVAAPSAAARPRDASGVLATAQQVGAAVGVAGAGTLYFAALPGDFAQAFQLATAWTLAGAGISALLALILAAPAGRLRAATSAAS
jgi:hypothetical protein